MNKLEAFGFIVAQAARGEITFPSSVNAVLRLQHALDDPDCPLGEAIRLVLAEPQLAARTVALANSAALGGVGGPPITNVRAAITRIGYRRLQALVASLVVRQFGSRIADPGLRAKAEQLWLHTTHVAALASVLARRVTGVNPDTALFAGIIHEVGGFYLLSRADAFPGLLDDDPDKWGELCEDVVGPEVLKKLAVPSPVSDAIGALRRAWVNMPPSTLRDTLLLANHFAPVDSPLGGKAESVPDHADSVLDFVIDAEMLATIRSEAEQARGTLEELLLV